MEKIFIVTAPTHIILPRVRVKDKKISLSLNWYRNAHHHVANQTKKIFCELISSQINSLPVMDKIALGFIYFSPNKQMSDLDNWCSVSNKFFQDCLVNAGKIKDDDYKTIRPIIYDYGGVSKTKKGFIEIRLKETK